MDNYFVSFRRDNGVLASPWDVLNFLAALGRGEQPEEGLRAWCAANAPNHLSAEGSQFVDFLAAALRVLSGKLPERVDAQASWLEDIEKIALALRGVRTYANSLGDWAKGCEPVLQQHLERLEAAVIAAKPEGTLALHGARAVKACQAYGVISPWEHIPTQIPAKAYEDEATRKQYFITWLVGELSPMAGESILAEVRQGKGPFHKLYAEHIAKTNKRPIEIMRWRARVNEELVGAIFLPHLGEGARLKVYACAEGTVWAHPYASGDHRVFLPWGFNTYEWYDSVVGNGVVRIKPVTPQPIEELDYAERTIHAMAEGKTEPDLETAFKVAAELTMDPCVLVLTLAAHAFDAAASFKGEEENTLLTWTTLALKTRVSLDIVAAKLDSPKLIEALMKVDETLKEAAHAVLLLDDERYELAVGGNPVDEEEWWGIRQEI